MNTLAPPRRKPRSLAQELVDRLGDRIRDGRLPEGAKLPTEAEIVGEFGVSRTVVREAISRLQAAGLVETRHGIGTFVIGLGDGGAFRVAHAQLQTLREVIALLELRIGIETEAAALAALRRTPQHLDAMQAALRAFGEAVEADGNAIGPDFQFHLEIARATENAHFERLMGSLGVQVIPRARLQAEPDPVLRAYLRRVHVEHENILAAIAAQDAEGARAAMRTHLANSRERRRRAAALAEGRPVDAG
ncbi:FadR/GntR family transcriptional regulator [Piscinibacter sakaiensis]|uniref:Putative D-glucarate n=1 Tax=Piscinibacter sakaiensis TaxID=1547922 RepID=A0A0K8NYB7_PISS1|nr:FadR/GntR family transcriptional regulator [Piscinibacter sakaiensis]GAP35376.1 putative D-glucarate [Piscinibacter sakaiensis]